MISPRPGRNVRPSTIFTWSRSFQTSSLTPRIGTLESLFGSPLRGRLATTTSSPEAMGLPCASFFTPGACMTTLALSRSRMELSSACEPPRSTMAVWSLPVARKVSAKPSLIASMATSTPTTPAMPTTTTEDEPSRWVTVASPTRVTCQVCRPRRVRAIHNTRIRARAAIPCQGNAIHTARKAATISSINRPKPNLFMDFISYSSAPGERVDDVETHRTDGGQGTDKRTDHHHQHETEDPCGCTDRWQVEHAATALGNDRDDDAGKRHAEHALAGEADGLQHGELVRALAYRLRHGVAGEQDQGEEHRAHDRRDDKADITELLGERRIERLLRLRLGFVVRVGR